MSQQQIQDVLNTYDGYDIPEDLSGVAVDYFLHAPASDESSSEDEAQSDFEVGNEILVPVGLRYCDIAVIVPTFFKFLIG
jgi:hypothetical protein